MKLIEYICKECNISTEVLFNSTEHIPEKIVCEKCGAFPAEKNTFTPKNNKQRWRYIDK